MAGPQSQRMHKTCHKAWNACLHHTPQGDTHEATPRQGSSGLGLSLQCHVTSFHYRHYLLHMLVFSSHIDLVTTFNLHVQTTTSSLNVHVFSHPTLLLVNAKTSKVRLDAFSHLNLSNKQRLLALIQAMDPVHSQVLRLYAPPPTVHPLLAPLDAPLGLWLSVLSLRLRYTAIRAHFTLLQPCTPVPSSLTRMISPSHQCFKIISAFSVAFESSDLWVWIIETESLLYLLGEHCLYAFFCM